MQEALVALYRAAACKMGFLESQLGSDPLPADAGTNTVSFDAASGVIEQLPAGMTFKSWDPGQPGDQYRNVYTTMVHEIASALRTTYAALTGDLSQANYGSLRQGELTAREGYRMEHGKLSSLVMGTLYPIIIEGARAQALIVSRLASDDLTRAVWHGRRWDWIDPKKDAEAIRELLALGLTTRTRELNKLGLDARQVFQELADEIALLTSLNIPTVVTTAQATAATATASAEQVAA
jgi:capsid protein